MSIRIVIAEDQALVRRDAALLLSMEPDMDVVGEARNGVEAVELVRALRPDVVLMDLHMPVRGGVSATREICATVPECQVLVLTTLTDDETMFEAVRAGAQTCLLKDADESEVLDTIRALRRGESRLTPPLALRIMDQLQRPHSEGLTDGQAATLRLLGAGKSIEQIAESTSAVGPDVERCIKGILDKLHATTRKEDAACRSSK